MGLAKENQSQLIYEPTEQIEMLHHDTDGWIALCKKEQNKWLQHHYKYYQVVSEVPKWTGKDSYVSMNTFYTPKRLATNLREIRAFYVDLDCYNVGYTPEQVVMHLKADYFGKVIPVPNLINYSGRGVNLIWFLQPLSGLAIDRWGKLQTRLLKELKPFGSDEASTDASRVFRLVGSTNSKSNQTVYAESLHDYHYDFQEVIEEYFPTIKAKPKPKTKGDLSKRKATVTNLHTEYSLIVARMKDLEKLIKMRNNHLEGCRELLLFLYRYWSLIETNNPEKALKLTLDLNDQLENPLPAEEVRRDTKSAERYFDSVEGFRISNAKIIKWLSITKEEQKQLITIISAAEKRRRNTEYQRKKRRDNGTVERQEYENNRKQQKQEMMLKIVELKEQGLSNKKIASKLGISTAYVGQLLKN